MGISMRAPWWQEEGTEEEAKWYLQYYGVDIGPRKGGERGLKYSLHFSLEGRLCFNRSLNILSTIYDKLHEWQDADGLAEETKKSNHVLRNLQNCQQDRKIDPHVGVQFVSGRLLAAISSWPGNCGPADGHIRARVRYEENPENIMERVMADSAA